jgi:hypothetical protein
MSLIHLDIDGVIDLDEGTTGQVVAPGISIIVGPKIDEQAGPIVSVQIPILLPTDLYCIQVVPTSRRALRGRFQPVSF